MGKIKPLPSRRRALDDIAVARGSRFANLTASAVLWWFSNRLDSSGVDMQKQ